MGPHTRGRKRLCKTGGEPLNDAKPGAYGYGADMDEVVFCDHAEEYTVSFLPLTVVPFCFVWDRATLIIELTRGQDWPLSISFSLAWA